MLLIHKVSYGSWTFKISGWSKKGRHLRARILQEYPFLSAEMADQVRHGMVDFRPLPFRELSDMDQKIKAATARMKDGQPGQASRVLISKGLAPINPDTLTRLEELHPPPRFPDPPIAPAPASIRRISRQQQPAAAINVRNFDLPKPSKASIVKIVKVLPKKSAPGPSGWTFGMVSSSMKDSKNFRDFLASIIYSISNDNRVPATDWLRASMLFPLKKKDDGIRPIACGEAFPRIAARWVLASFRPLDHLLPEQYGVGTGVDETVCHINDSVELSANGMSSFDLTNAFNSVSRHHLATVVGVETPFLLGYFRWGYGVASSLFVRGSKEVHELHSREGGRQGDPMFPFLFSLAIRPLVDELATKFAATVNLADKDGDITTKRLIWAYLDDITIALRPGVSHQDVLDFLSDPDIVDKFGLSVNPTKSWYMSPRRDWPPAPRLLDWRSERRYFWRCPSLRQGPGQAGFHHPDPQTYDHSERIRPPSNVLLPDYQPSSSYLASSSRLF
jgi:hypothetical protein